MFFTRRDREKLEQIHACILGLGLLVDDMAQTLDQILEKVTAHDTTIDSVLELVKGLKEQIAALQLDPQSQAKIDAIFARVDQNQTKLATALDANVP